MDSAEIVLEQKMDKAVRVYDVLKIIRLVLVIVGIALIFIASAFKSSFPVYEVKEEREEESGESEEIKIIYNEYSESLSDSSKSVYFDVTAAYCLGVVNEYRSNGGITEKGYYIAYNADGDDVVLKVYGSSKIKDFDEKLLSLNEPIRFFGTVGIADQIEKDGYYLGKAVNSIWDDEAVKNSEHFADKESYEESVDLFNALIKDRKMITGDTVERTTRTNINLNNTTRKRSSNRILYDIAFALIVIALFLKFPMDWQYKKAVCMEAALTKIREQKYLEEKEEIPETVEQSAESYE